MDYGLDFRLDSIPISCQLHSVYSFTAFLHYMLCTNWIRKPWLSTGGEVKDYVHINQPKLTVGTSTDW